MRWDERRGRYYYKCWFRERDYRINNRERERERVRNWTKNNRDQINHTRRERRKDIAEKLMRMFGNMCHRCGETFPFIVYDFHHVTGDKEKQISLMMNSNWGTIKKEAEKCIMVCSNCHRIIHYEEGQNAEEYLKDALIMVEE